MNRIYKIVWSKAKKCLCGNVGTGEEPHEKRFGESSESGAGGRRGDGAPHGRLYGKRSR